MLDDVAVDPELQRAFLVEFEQLCQLRRQRISVLMSPLQAWLVLAQLQLALRHPENRGPSAILVEQIARQIQERVAPPGTVLERVAEQGWRAEGARSNRAAASAPREPPATG